LREGLPHSGHHVATESPTPFVCRRTSAPLSHRAQTKGGDSVISYKQKGTRPKRIEP